MLQRSIFALLTVALILPPAAVAETPEFAADIAPLLRKYCAGCHNDDDREGELSLESFSALMRGAENGPVVVPGKPAASKLVQVLAADAELPMPPDDMDGPSSAETEQIRTWISAGAPAPTSAAPRPRRSSETLVDHPSISSIASSRDGSRYAVGYYQRVEIISAADDRVLETLTGLPGKVTALQFSADDQQLVTASGVAGESGQATLWNVSEFARIRDFEGHRDILYDAEFSPAGNLIATCSYDRQVILWDAGTGAPLRTLTGHNDAVYDLAFSPDGQVLATASGDETIKLWHVDTGQRLDTLSQPQAEQFVVCFSPDGNYVVAGGADNRIRVWNFISRTEQRINPIAHARFAHEGPITALKFVDGGRWLVSAGADHALKQWSPQDFRQLHRFENLTDQATGIAELGGSSQFLVAQIDGQISRNEPVVKHSLGESAEEMQQPVLTVETDARNRLVEHEPNDAPQTAMQVYLPAVIDGLVDDESGTDSDFYRFAAEQGQEWILEVAAARNDSPLDSFLEVLDASGEPIERVLLQATRDSYFTFRGKDSATVDDFRLHNWQEMDLNQYLYANGEVSKLWRYPRGPDSGFMVYPGRGKRHGFFDTTPLAHALHEPCYIVEPRAPGEPLISNGLPVFSLYYQNDDDSRRELGVDSRLTFRAPYDGQFLARITDVRGFSGSDYRYQLTIRPRQPDFELTLTGADPVLSPGSGREFAIEVKRVDGFEGEIHLDAQNVPPGFQVSTPLVIEAGQDLALGSIVAENAATLPTTEFPPITFVPSATIRGRRVQREPLSLGKIELTKKAEFGVEIVAAEDSPTAQVEDGRLELTIQPGETITAKVRVDRRGFEGGVPFGKADAGRNLPHGVYVDNIGLNGLLVVAGQEERTFYITAAPWVQETSRLFHLRMETEGNVATPPVLLHVRRDRLATADAP